MKLMRYVSFDRALQHVAGYCVINDVCERSYQFDRGGQWDKGNGCDRLKPPRWLQEGDVVELTIDGLGVQRQRVGRYRL
jgi:2-keto-4-pentenoate hydratase/2-oxohepta-3-ene-1,7-dioic acid hydratase in catechol pathway